MKVILLKDVKDMGRAGSTQEVSDGHGLNFLIPRGLAVLATPGAAKQAEMHAKKNEGRKELDMKLIEERLAALAEGKITVVKKANEQGHLYDAVDAKELAEAAALPENAIKLEKPLKEVGTFEIPVAIGENFGKFTLVIEAE